MKRVFTLMLVFFVVIQVEGVAQPLLGPDIMACPDQMVTLDAGPGFVSYLWNTGSTTQWITVSAGIYWVEVTTSSGNTMRDTVSVIYYPSILPLTVTVFYSYCGQNNGGIAIMEPQELDYLYSIDGGINFQEDEHFYGLAAGVYEIWVQDSYGCVNTLMPVTIVDFAAPLIIEIETTPANNGQSDGSLTIIATGELLRYRINDSELQSSGYFPDLPGGIYQCYAQDIFDCIVESQATVPVIMGANNVVGGNRYFTISPNPAKGICRITFGTVVPGSVSVTISDLKGKVVKHIPFTQGKELQFEHHLSPGLYFVSVETNGNRYIEKLVVI